MHYVYKNVNQFVIHLYALYLLSVAVIILEQSFACNPAYYITEGNNATACATIVYTYGNLPLATNISVLFTTSNGTALSTYVEAKIKYLLLKYIYNIIYIININNAFVHVHA